jgi:hypothetical protein
MEHQQSVDQCIELCRKAQQLGVAKSTVMLWSRGQQRSHDTKPGKIRKTVQFRSVSVQFPAFLSVVMPIPRGLRFLSKTKSGKETVNKR